MSDPITTLVSPMSELDVLITAVHAALKTGPLAVLECIHKKGRLTVGVGMCRVIFEPKHAQYDTMLNTIKWAMESEITDVAKDLVTIAIDPPNAATAIRNLKNFVSDWQQV